MARDIRPLALKLLRPAAIALAAALLLAPAPALSQGREGRRTPVVRAVERAAHAVVYISARQLRRRANPFSTFNNPMMDEFFREFFRRPSRRRRPSSLGSGVLIRPDGYILTNEHVVSRAAEVRVSLTNKRTFSARIIGADPANDLAVIKIDADAPLPFLPMGRSDDLMIGETVIAIGNPFGLAHTVTTGVVSALGRSLEENRRGRPRSPSDFIQTDASINPGNSGGPLLNIYGQLIGINTAIFTNAQGIGFAIPIDRARRIVDDLILFGKVRKGWVGLILQNLTPRVAKLLNYPKKRGVIAVKVLKGSPAAQGGVRRGDILLDFGGKEILSRQDYLNELSGYTVGSQVKVKLWREAEIIERRITLAEAPGELADEVARNWLGVRVAAIDKENFRRYRLQSRKGVLIKRVIRGGPAHSIGMRPGDIIRQVNSRDTDTLPVFRQALVRARELPRLQLIVQRQGELYNVHLEP